MILTYKRADEGDWSRRDWIVFEFAKAAAAAAASAVVTEAFRIIYERYRSAKDDAAGQA